MKRLEEDHREGRRTDVMSFVVAENARDKIQRAKVNEFRVMDRKRLVLEGILKN